jgi:hypothetical protein
MNTRSRHPPTRFSEQVIGLAGSNNDHTAGREIDSGHSIAQTELDTAYSLHLYYDHTTGACKATGCTYPLRDDLKSQGWRYSKNPRPHWTRNFVDVGALRQGVKLLGELVDLDLTTTGPVEDPLSTESDYDSESEYEAVNSDDDELDSAASEPPADEFAPESEQWTCSHCYFPHTLVSHKKDTICTVCDTTRPPACSAGHDQV